MKRPVTHDPIKRFLRWFDDALRREIPRADALALATSDARGLPSVRFVLLKGADQRGFVFFTDARSRKGRELRARSRAAAALYWQPLGRQVRIEGHIEAVTAAESDAYFDGRPRLSQLAAAASRQSAPLESRDVLLARWTEMRRRYRGRAIPRPSYWVGFRIVPQSIEFWISRPHRLHDRELYVRTRTGWRRTLLQP